MENETTGQGSLRPSTGVMVKPVSNAISIIRFLTLSGTPERASDIARELSINPSTCFNILRTLVAEGMIDFSALSKTYTPGLGLAKLLDHLVTQGQRLDVAKPLMQELAARFHVTATLWRQMGSDRIVLVCSETSPSDLRIDMAVGQRLPILMGASGRLFAAHMKLDIPTMQAAFNKVRWARPLSFDEYLAQVALARECGWAIDDGYFSAGIQTIAAPIRERNTGIAATLSAVMFRGQHPSEDLKKIGEAVRKLANKLSSLLY